MTSVDRVLTALNAHDLEEFVNCYRLMFESFPSLHVQALGRWEIGSFVVQEELVTGRTAEPEHHIAIYQLTNDLIVRERLLRRTC